MLKPYSIRVQEYLKNYRLVAERVKEIVREIEPCAEIYVFGSVVSGKYTGASDIDIIVIVEKLDKKYEIMTRVYSLIEAPVELHVVNRELFNKWYLRFIKENELVKID